MTGTCLQIGLDGIAEYIYLTHPNWKDHMHAHIEPLKHVPKALDYKEWQYFGVDVNPTSIDFMAYRYRLKNAKFIIACVKGDNKVGFVNYVISRIAGDIYKKNVTYELNNDLVQTCYVVKMSLSTLINLLGLQTLDVLAVDIEGTEQEIFENYDWKIKPRYISVEMHHLFPNFTMNQQEFEAIFTRQGYKKINEEDTNGLPTFPPHCRTKELQFLLED